MPPAWEPAHITATLVTGEDSVHVLLVEDDAVIREVLGDALQGAGLSTVGSASAEAALELLGEHMPDVVVTDINLGAGMDGLALGRAVRARFPGLPFVYISGRYSGVSGLDSGERFLPKPFPASLLLRAIEDVREHAQDKNGHAEE
jgi:CheY-like chemotaxis protein